MLKVKSLKQGMMLVSILLLTFLLVMLTVSIVLISSQSLNVTGRADKSAKALEAAYAGIEYAYYHLSKDSNWTSAGNITEDLGNEEQFTIIFDPAERYHSCNNLTNAHPVGKTPRFAAEIICKGTFKKSGAEKYNNYVRAVFLREDKFQYPLATEGLLNIGGWTWSGYENTTTIKGKKTDDRGRVHSNGNVNIENFYTGEYNFDTEKECFVSSATTIDIFNVGGKIQKKENVPPVKIPEIDVNDIINKNKASCLEVPTDRFYLVGCFEHNSSSVPPYCIPHESYVEESVWDPKVYEHPYKLGIASLQEDSFSEFMNNYMDFYGKDYWFWFGEPPTDRNFYEHYPGLTFWEYSSTNRDFDELNITVEEDDDPGGFKVVTLTLNSDLYVPGVLGLWETQIPCQWSEEIEEPHKMDANYNPYYMWDAKVQLNMNNHIIYGEKVYIGIPTIGKGAIITNQTVDFTISYDTDLTVLSGESVRMAYQTREYNPNPYINLNGIIYAKDDIAIQAMDIWGWWGDYPSLNINGSMVCSDANTANFQPSPMCWPMQIYYSPPYNENNFFAVADFYVSELNITHTDDGLDTLASIRGSGFKIRRGFCEIIK